MINFFKRLASALFGASDPTITEQMIAGAQIFPQYEGQRIPPMTPDQVSAYQDSVSKQQDAMPGTWARKVPGRLAEGLMREAPPEVMAQFSEEDLEADVPLSKAKKGKKKPSKPLPIKWVGHTKRPGQPLKARKALKKAKARKRKT